MKEVPMSCSRARPSAVLLVPVTVRQLWQTPDGRSPTVVKRG
jgi:hypothetical protein